MEKQGDDRKAKTCKSRRETAVQGTNDSSIVSKCSMAQVGYFSDPFLQEFVSKTTRRAPLIHRGYYIRAKTIDYILKKFLSSTTEYKQIISLGAGFDSAYFRLGAENCLDKTTFFEIDFPDVVRRKHALIEGNERLAGLIPGLSEQGHPKDPLIEINTRDYKLLGVDLTQLNTLEALLKLSDVDFDSPTLLLSECVMTYMTRRCSTAVITWAAETFSRAVFVLYEQINPDDAFGLFMQNHFQVIGSPLKCINSYPTLQSQIDRFSKAGWSRCEAMDMNQFYQCIIDREERNRVEDLEPFDEYEEWNLKCAHYMVICGHNTDSEPLIQGDSSALKQTQTGGIISIEFLPLHQSIQRFGHSTTVLRGSGNNTSNLLVTFGGFGEMDGKHRRLVDIAITDTASWDTYLVHPEVNPKEIEVSRMHDQPCPLSDGSVILIGGRTSPIKLCVQLLKIEFSKAKVRTDSEYKENLDTNRRLTDKNEDTEISNSKLISHSSKHIVDSEVSNSLTKEMQILSEASKLNCDLADRGNKDIEMLPCSSQPTGNEDSSVVFSEDDKFSSVSCSVVEQNGEIPSPRWRHTAIPVTIHGKEYIFLYGGRSEKNLALDDGYLLDLDTWTWSEVKPSTFVSPGRRHTHTATYWKDCVIISGGLNHDQQPLNSIYSLNLLTKEWIEISPHPELLPRYSHTAHMVDDTLVLIGGINSNHSPPGVAVINLVSHHAVELSLPKANKSHLCMLHRHTSCYLSNGKFAVIGGGGNCFSFGTHLNKSPFILDISNFLVRQ